MEKNKSDILSQVAAFSMHNDVRMLRKAAEFAKNDLLTLTVVNEDNVVPLLQKEMGHIKRRSLKALYPDKEVVITGNVIVDAILLDIQKLDFSKLDKVEDGLDWYIYTTKPLILKYMMDLLLRKDEEKEKAKKYIGEEYLSVFFNMTKEELKEELSLNKFTRHFDSYCFDELQVKYYFEALYIAVNHFASLYEEVYISDTSLIGFLEDEVIEYVNVMTDYDEGEE